MVAERAKKDAERTRATELRGMPGPHHFTFISRPSSHTSTIFRADIERAD
jgi:hypothetical protein